MAKTRSASKTAKTSKSAKAAKKTAPKAARTTAKRTARTAAKATGRPRAAKRELITPRGDARFVRREAGGEFSESDDVGRALQIDRKTKAVKKVKSGQGDKGDR